MQSQCTNTEMPTLFCADAPLTCLDSSCYTTTSDVFTCCQGFCGINTVIHNPQYFLILPDGEEIEIHIHVDDCPPGEGGLQSALVSSCEWAPCPPGIFPCADVLDCDPGTNEGGIMVLSASGISPDEPLYLIVDGSNAAVCQYTITYTSGIYQPEIEGEIDTVLISESVVCPGLSSLQMSASFTLLNASHYIWTTEWNNDTIMTSDPILDLSVDADAPAGTWEICVHGASGCDVSSPFCFPIEITEIPMLEKPAASFCAEQAFIIWGTDTIIESGIYTQSFQEANGCVFDSVWHVTILPEVIPGLIDTIQCQAPFIYEGIEYAMSGTYEIYYPGMSSTGCDSSALLHLTFWGNHFVEIVCTETEIFLDPFFPDLSGNDTAQTAWYDCSFSTLLSNEMALPVFSDTCVCLVATSGMCADTICATFQPLCNTSCIIAPSQSCINEAIELVYSGNAGASAEFHWLITSDIGAPVYLSGNDTITWSSDTAGCYFISLTVEENGLTTTCRDTLCISGSGSVVELCCDSISCDPCLTLTLTFSGIGPWTVVIEGNDETDTIANITTSPYSYEVCLENDHLDYPFSIIEAWESVTNCPVTISELNTSVLNHEPGNQVSINHTGELLIASSGMQSYTWRHCDSTTVLSTERLFLPVSTGCYCVDGLNAQGCFSTDCIDFISAVKPIDQAIRMAIIPNPNTGKFFIRLEKPTKDAFYSLVDILGNKIATGRITLSNQEIDLSSSVKPGIYIIQVVVGQQSDVRKLIIE